MELLFKCKTDYNNDITEVYFNKNSGCVGNYKFSGLRPITSELTRKLFVEYIDHENRVILPSIDPIVIIKTIQGEKEMKLSEYFTKYQSNPCYIYLKDNQQPSS